VVELSANIENIDPQLFSALCDTLLAAGALEVWVETVTMKKSRPGHVLHAWAPSGAETDLGAVMLRETTSLGVRAKRASRLMLAREWCEVTTSGRPVRVRLGAPGWLAAKIPAASANNFGSNRGVYVHGQAVGKAPFLSLSCPHRPLPHISKVIRPFHLSVSRLCGSPAEIAP
jgi:hypothetical protein